MRQYERKLARGSRGGFTPASGGLEPASGGFTAVGPPVDNDRKRVSRASWTALPAWDVLVPSTRRRIWAIMKVAKPRWVHTAPPCTFWSSLSRWHNTRGDFVNEQFRLKALALIVFSAQLCEYQVRAGRLCSFERPASCSRWRLDIVNELATQTLAAGNVLFDSCAWGAQRPRTQYAIFEAAAFRCERTPCRLMPPVLLPVRTRDCAWRGYKRRAKRC